MTTDSSPPVGEQNQEEVVDEPVVRGDMTIFEHLIELRNRTVVAAVSVLLGVVVVLYFTWDPHPSLQVNTFDILLEPARSRIDFSLERAQEILGRQLDTELEDALQLAGIEISKTENIVGMYIFPQTEFLGEKPILDVDDTGAVFFKTLGLDKFDRKDVIEVFARDASRGLQPPHFDDLDEVVTVQGALDLLGKSSESDFRLASFSPTDRITAIFQVALYGGLLIAAPVLIYQLLAFIIPGLTGSERRILIFGVFGCLVFLVSGMAFAYFIVLERALSFLLGVASDTVDNVIGIKEYIGFVTRIILWVGFSFQLPMVLALAARIGLVTAGQLLRFWRYAIVIVFVIAAIATPTPDPQTQAIVALPLLILYFLGVLFAKIFYQPRAGSVIPSVAGAVEGDGTS
jgi:sec-independent protein translocase protein TatC